MLELKPLNPLLLGTLGLLIVAGTAGCLDEQKGAATAPDTSSGVAAPTFPKAEHDLMIRYFAMSAAVPVYIPAPGNEGSWTVKVPDGADNVTLNATWSPSTPFARIQHCMIHAAQGDQPGPMLAEKKGTSPLSVPRATLPNGTEALVIMCMPMNEPVAAEIMQMIHLNVEFSKGAPK